MSIPGNENGWKWRNSLWLIWCFLFGLNWIPFFWIGARAKKIKWSLFGCLYLVSCLVLPIFFANFENILSDISIGSMLIAWPVSVVHAFLSRNEYLIRRKMIVDNEKSLDSVYQLKIQDEYTVNNIDFHNTESPIIACKKAVEYYLHTNESTPYFRERLGLISNRLDVFYTSGLNIQDVISARFGSGGISYDKFAAPVLALQDHLYYMVTRLVSQMRIFSEEDYSRRIDEFTQANRLQEAQDYKNLEQEYKDCSEKTLEAIDKSILKLDMLILEISKLDKTELDNASHIMQELDKTIKDTQYYK